MNSDPTVWERINGVQQYVRERLENQFTGYRVNELVANVKSLYAQPLHALTENPDFIQESSVAAFHAVLESRSFPINMLRVQAILGANGRVEASVLETILVRGRKGK